MLAAVSGDDPADEILGVEVRDAGQNSGNSTGGVRDGRGHRHQGSTGNLAQPWSTDDRLPSLQRGGEIVAVGKTLIVGARRLQGVGDLDAV